MANEKNLEKGKATQFKSGEEAAKNGRKGGKASGEARRKQKTYRELAKAMLSATLTNENMLAELQAFGISETDVKAYTLLGLIKASAEGSHNAFDRLLELTGEKEQNSNKDVISKLDEVIKGIDAIADE